MGKSGSGKKGSVHRRQHNAVPKVLLAEQVRKAKLFLTRPSMDGVGDRADEAAAMQFMHTEISRLELGRQYSGTATAGHNPKGEPKPCGNCGKSIPQKRLDATNNKATLCVKCQELIEAQSPIRLPPPPDKRSLRLLV